jgi:hypothetical protein
LSGTLGLSCRRAPQFFHDGRDIMQPHPAAAPCSNRRTAAAAVVRSIPARATPPHAHSVAAMKRRPEGSTSRFRRIVAPVTVFVRNYPAGSSPALARVFTATACRLFEFVIFS